MMNWGQGGGGQSGGGGSGFGGGAPMQKPQMPQMKPQMPGNSAFGQGQGNPSPGMPQMPQFRNPLSGAPASTPTVGGMTMSPAGGQPMPQPQMGGFAAQQQRPMSFLSQFFPQNMQGADWGGMLRQMLQPAAQMGGMQPPQMPQMPGQGQQQPFDMRSKIMSMFGGQ